MQNLWDSNSNRPNSYRIAMEQWEHVFVPPSPFNSVYQVKKFEKCFTLIQAVMHIGS